jgi:hypothetical protein
MEGLLAIYKDTIRKKLILTSEAWFGKIVGFFGAGQIESLIVRSKWTNRVG